jgi:hypothetical protein
MHDIIKREISAGNSPMAVAGSVIYLSAMNTGEKPRDFAREAGVSVNVCRKFNLDATLE